MSKHKRRRSSSSAYDPSFNPSKVAKTAVRRGRGRGRGASRGTGRGASRGGGQVRTGTGMDEGASIGTLVAGTDAGTGVITAGLKIKITGQQMRTINVGKVDEGWEEGSDDEMDYEPRLRNSGKRWNKGKKKNYDDEDYVDANERKKLKNTQIKAQVKARSKAKRGRKKGGKDEIPWDVSL